VDECKPLFAGLLYLKHPADKSSGGDLRAGAYTRPLLGTT